MESVQWTPVLSTKVSTPAYKNPWNQLASSLPYITAKVQELNEAKKGNLDYKRDQDIRSNLDYKRNDDKKGNLKKKRKGNKKGNLDYKRNEDKKCNLEYKDFLPLVFPSNEELDILKRSKEPFIDINEEGVLFTNNTDGDWKKCMIFSEILGKLSEDVESAWTLLDAAIISDPGFVLRWLKMMPSPGEEQTPKHFRFEQYAHVCKLKQMIENAFPSILTSKPSDYTQLSFKKAARNKMKMVNRRFQLRKKMDECIYGIENCPCMDRAKKNIERLSTVHNTNKEQAVAKDLNKGETAAKDVTEEESSANDITEAKDINTEESAGKLINEKWLKNKVLNGNLYDDLTEEELAELRASGEPYLIVLPKKFTIHTANKKSFWRRCLLFSEIQKCSKGETLRDLARSDPGVLIRWIEAPIYYRGGQLPRAKTFRVMNQENFNKLKDALEAEFPITIIDFHAERINFEAEPRTRARLLKRLKKRNEIRLKIEKEKEIHNSSSSLLDPDPLDPQHFKIPGS